MKRYESDKVTQGFLFGDADMDFYSAMQVTELVAKDYIEMAEEHADHYLAD